MMILTVLGAFISLLIALALVTEILSRVFALWSYREDKIYYVREIEKIHKKLEEKNESLLEK